MESQDIVLEGEDTSQRAVTKLERESGRSLLPVARVQKILKADKELDGIAKEAVFVLSMATVSVSLIDIFTILESPDSIDTFILTVTRRETEYFFLGDIFEETNTLKLTAAKKKEGDGKVKDSIPPVENTLLHAFAQTKAHSVSPSAREDAQSEVASLPPSSRPSTPLSLGDGQSEQAEEMEEDDWYV
ncbi:hypothetical protein FRC20_006855 [Serendipita sp. 405]|nr:hypothetical protein FRC20_006855 [Serendipita sp. 405]